MKISACATPHEDSNGFVLKAPDLPGCQCVTATISEGINELKKVIDEHLLLLIEYGEAIPPLREIEEHLIANSRSNVVWFIVELDESAYLGKSHKINVTLPERLIRRIDDRVSKSENYKSRSDFLAKAAINELK